MVAEAARLAGLSVMGVLDDRADCAAARELEHLGPVFDRGGAAEALGAPPFAGVAYIVCLGDVQLRRRVLDSLAGRFNPATIMHPAAFVSPSARIGRGVFVGPGAVVHSRAEIGDHAIINSGVIIEHDCVVGENTHVAPGVVMAGASRAGRNVLLGVGSRVIPGKKIGDGAVVGAGAVVIDDVAPGATVKGMPAR